MHVNTISRRYVMESTWRRSGRPVAFVRPGSAAVLLVFAWFGAACVAADSRVARAAATTSQERADDRTMPRAAWRDSPPAVRTYVAPRLASAVTIDGRLDEAAWQVAAWSSDFTDIEGDVRPAPLHRTRVRMLWDDTHWYIGADLEEPDLWATIVQRDAVIFQDNDFEIFVDPDGDTHRYFELEINAFGTVWDLFLPKPYRDGGRAVDGWNIDGLRSAVAVSGTLNDPRDRDRGWSVELAIPWTAFADSGRTTIPPKDGDAWRVNFSRVHWDLDVVDGAYRKRVDAATGKPLAEYNWVWSPQGGINMHMPEMWGIVRFGGTPRPESVDDTARWALRRIYYAQREHRKEQGQWSWTLSALGLAGVPPTVSLVREAEGWRASAVDAGGVRWNIRADGLVWRE